MARRSLDPIVLTLRDGTDVTFFLSAWDLMQLQKDPRVSFNGAENSLETMIRILFAAYQDRPAELTEEVFARSLVAHLDELADVVNRLLRTDYEPKFLRPTSPTPAMGPVN